MPFFIGRASRDAPAEFGSRRPTHRARRKARSGADARTDSGRSPASQRIRFWRRPVRVPDVALKPRYGGNQSAPTASRAFPTKTPSAPRWNSGSLPDRNLPKWLQCRLPKGARPDRGLRGASVLLRSIALTRVQGGGHGAPRPSLQHRLQHPDRAFRLKIVSAQQLALQRHQNAAAASHHGLPKNQPLPFGREDCGALLVHRLSAKLQTGGLPIPAVVGRLDLPKRLPSAWAQGHAVIAGRRPAPSGRCRSPL